MTLTNSNISSTFTANSFILKKCGMSVYKIFFSLAVHPFSCPCPFIVILKSLQAQHIFDQHAGSCVFELLHVSVSSTTVNYSDKF